MVELDLLLRFAVVAEELSFTKAAVRLHVDQPWLSRQIQRLETQLGFPLLLRSTRSVSLTSEGAVLLAQVRDLAEVADRTRSTIREMIRSYNALITLGVNPTTYWIPERHRLIARFEARYGDNSVELVSNYKPRLLSKLRKHLLDVAVIPEPFEYHDLEALVIHRSHPTLLVPEDDPLARQEVVKLSDLAGKRIATTNPNLGAEFHQKKYGPFFEAGAIPVVIPKGISHDLHRQPAEADPGGAVLAGLRPDPAAQLRAGAPVSPRARRSIRPGPPARGAAIAAEPVLGNGARTVR